MTNWKNWAKAAGIRAVKTAAQTAVALIGTGAIGFTDLDWVRIASVSGVAAVVSLLTSLAGLPELNDEDQPKALMAVDFDTDTGFGFDTDFDSDSE